MPRVRGWDGARPQAPSWEAELEPRGGRGEARVCRGTLPPPQPHLGGLSGSRARPQAAPMPAEGAKPGTGGGRRELELSLGERGFVTSPQLFPSGDVGRRGSGSQRLVSAGDIAGVAPTSRGLHPDLSCLPGGWGPGTDPALRTRLFLGWFCGLCSAMPRQA